MNRIEEWRELPEQQTEQLHLISGYGDREEIERELVLVGSGHS